MQLDDGAEPFWLTATSTREPPEQGWKLHVSAGAPSAEAVLRRVLPVLLAEDAMFKIAASTEKVAQLDHGVGGLSQVGKFVTVYPHDDVQAVRLARALDRATRGLRGPEVRSDRPVSLGSLVSYRYGSFGDRVIHTPLGAAVPAIAAPSGELLADGRVPFYGAPSWAVDPFLAAGMGGEGRPSGVVVAERYALIATLHDSPRATVYLALDLVGRRRCVLKRARRDAQLQHDGTDARDRLRHEAGVLGRLAPDERFPTAYDLVEKESDLFLAMEDMEGETLEQHVLGLARRGCHVEARRATAWAHELAGALATIHAAGLVYGDLKSPNVIVGRDGRLRLVDFELACELGARVGQPSVGPCRCGTRGYLSPQRARGHPADVRDDVYGLGALLYFLCTGAEPSLAPEAFALMDRPPSLLAPRTPRRLCAVIARCLDPDPGERFPSMAAIAAALSEVEDEPALTSRRLPGRAADSTVNAQDRFGELARRLADTLCAAAEPVGEGGAAGWTSRHPEGNRLGYGLDTGAAGTALALAELVGEIRHPDHAASLRAGARGLLRASRGGGPMLPGLYVGEAGVGAALLRAGQVLGDADLVAAAARRSRCIAREPHVSPDIFNGSAGRLRYHLMVWDETGERAHLDAALVAGESLLAAAQTAPGGGLRWTIPPGYGWLSGAAFLGFAHGAAGIGDALLDLFEATADERFLAAARQAVRWLARLAVPVLDDRSGLAWPRAEGDAPCAAFWCHGATGIGLFLLHAAKAEATEEAGALSARAASTAARGTRWAGPTQCHGLAGNCELLLDMFQATGDEAYLVEAITLGRILEAFVQEREGALVCPSEHPETFTPDYMVGYAGVALAFLRLSDPERLPRQLTRLGFRTSPPRGAVDRGPPITAFR